IRTTLMKRLSSCGQSFMVSVERHLVRNHVLLHAIDAGLALPIGTVEDRRWEYLTDQSDTALDGLDLDAGNAVGRTAEQWAAVAETRYVALAHKPRSGLLWLAPSFFTP